MRVGLAHAEPASSDAAHRQQAEAHPALDRPQWRRRLVGDLLLGQPAEVGELDRLALDVRQRRQRALDGGGVEPGRDLGPDVGEPQRVGRRELDVGQLGRRPATADGVDRTVMDDGQQPRLHAAPALDVAGGIAPRAQEGFLDDVLGEGRVIRDAVCDRVGHRLVAVIQVPESIELPIGQAHEHGPIGLVRGGRDPESGRRVHLAHLGSACRVGDSVHPSRPAGRSRRRRHARPRRCRDRHRRPRTGRVRRPRGPGNRPAPGGGRRGRTRPRSGSRHRAPCAPGPPRPRGRAGS